MMHRPNPLEPEPMTAEEEELGRLLSEQYPELAQLLLAAADITHLSHDQRKNEAFLLAVSDIVAHVLARRMPREEAAAYVSSAVEELKNELRDNLLGSQTGPWARAEQGPY